MIEIPGKIPIRIHPVFWVLVILLSALSAGFGADVPISDSLVKTGIWAGVIVFSLMVHEYGHALSAVFFGQTAQIDLMGMGGLTTRNGPALSKWKDFVIVLNGPVAGFILCGIAYFLSGKLNLPRDSLLSYTLRILIYVNLFWTILNLMPVQPLDGGRLLGIFLEGIFGIRGLRISFFISMLVAGVLGIFFLLIQALIGAVFFFMFAFESYRGWNDLSQMSDVDRSEGLQGELQSAEAMAKEGLYQEALNKFAEIMKKSGKGMIYQNALEESAAIYTHLQNYESAYLLLAPNKKNLSPEGKSLYHNVAYHTEHWDDIVRSGSDVYQLYPTPTAALINAVAHARLNQVKPAVGWLKTALDAGFDNPHLILQRPDFDGIRKAPEFQELYRVYM